MPLVPARMGSAINIVFFLQSQHNLAIQQFHIIKHELDIGFVDHFIVF
jgi:hypothetical protein